ncbi:DUF1345 domain-containing protein [Paucibacter sp. R3-3]|uniref:DUF1345 domain-containing protein n=1 Tax=Roseateles agri TaxID=3098619 RepID=A0ABU5DIL4_9BURK|nr:DUF1345 domain-containing protein [Paucibacter sp. R3-3]MDY0746136.1 DUF1345 domain-containing protein [Paucibacter sp. R3-3]
MSLLRSLRHRPRLICSIALALVLPWLLPDSVPAPTRALIGWDAGVWLYLALLLQMMFKENGSSHLQRTAQANADSMWAVLMVATLGATASLVAVALEQSQVKQGLGTLHGLPYLVLVISTVVGSWLLLPVEFALAYAGIYHQDSAKGTEPHGLEFPGQDDHPDYLDFMYFAITLAATSQTSDVAVSSRPMRRLVLIHAGLSFVFNTCVLALTINILAGLIS